MSKEARNGCMRSAIPTILVSLLLSGLATGYANVPVASYLDVPTDGQEKLSPATISELRSEELQHDLAATDESILRVFCSGSLNPGSAFAVAVNREATGSFIVTGFQSDWTSEKDHVPKKISVPLEAGLGNRIQAVMQAELLRIVPGSRPTGVYLDVDTYLFWVKSERGPLMGKIQGERAEKTRISRALQLARRLNALACSKDEDRTEILGAIDRCVTEMELAGQFLK